MKKLFFALGLLFLLCPQIAQAQSNRNPCFYTVTPSPTDGCIPVSSSKPLPVAATASISGFTPNLNYATLTATNASASVALPSGTTVAIQNTGTTAVSCTLGVGSATAVASQILVQAASTVFVTPGSNTFGACIDQTGSASNLVVLAGGTGLGTGFGGGGGSGGAITAASGSYASGALSAGAFAAGAGVDGWDLSQGAKADAACGTATGTCSVISLLKYNNATSPVLGAGTARVGYTSDDPCSQKAKTNLPISQNGTSSVQLIALSGSTVVYVCSLSLIAAGATTVAITTGTGTACVTGNAAVIGTTTASIANSLSLAANGGLTLGNGAGTIAQGAASSELCMVLGTNVFVSGNLTYVQQ